MPPYRRITLAVGLAMFVDATLYLALLPLLPRYADQYHLSTLGIAVLLAAYPAPSPFVSLACIGLLPRLGGRNIALGSAVLMTLATVAYALAPNIEVLVGARFLQGVASGTVWTSSMAWVTHNAPVDRRGRESGIVMGMLSAGSIVGPGIGALAAWAGSAPAFLLVAGASAAGVAATAAAPTGTPVLPETHIRSSIRRVLRVPLARAAVAMALIDPLAFATVDLLVPLDLGHHGTSTFVIATALTVGAVLGAVAGPVGGRFVDRLGAGRVGLAMATLVAATPLVLALGLPPWGELAVLIVASPIFAVAASAMYPLASFGADRARVAHVVVTGLLGALWAVGFTIAPLVTGALAHAAGQAAAFVVGGLLCVPLLVVIAQGRATPVAGEVSQPQRSPT